MKRRHFLKSMATASLAGGVSTQATAAINDSGAMQVDATKIRALGISAQGETLIFVDEQGKPLRNAIVWMDNRAQEEAENLGKEFPQQHSYKITGQVSIVPTWPASSYVNETYDRLYQEQATTVDEERRRETV